MNSTPKGKGTHRFLITGGAGFIGSHLAEKLLSQGHCVTVIDDLSTGRFENIQPLIDRWGVGGRNAFHFAIDTITNESVLDRLASECDTIIHLAAAVGVKLIVQHPVHTIKTNVMGTEAVLNAALRYRAEVLIASTSEVYGKGHRIPFREDDDVLLGPTIRNRWGYAASKMVDEFLAFAYHHEKGLPVKLFRLFNTVGPRQTGQYGMVIPNFVSQASQGQPLSVYGSGKQARCFMHVYDAVDAIVKLIECEEAVGQVFNIGSTEEVTILQLAERVLKHVDGVMHLADMPHPRLEGSDYVRSGRITFIPYDEAYAPGFEDMERRVPDISRLHKLTGWTPRHSLDEILGDVLRTLVDVRAVA